MKQHSGKDTRWWLSWFLCFLYMSAIFFLSSRPHVPHFTSINFEDSVLHIAEYSVLGLISARAFFNSGVPRPVVCAFVFSFLYGATDELHQSFVPGRNASISDLVADGVGSLIGAAFWRYVSSKNWGHLLKDDVTRNVSPDRDLAPLPYPRKDATR